MIFTDPPYNVDYEGKRKIRRKIANDKMSADSFYSFLLAVFQSAAKVCTPGTPIYVCYSDAEAINFRKSMIDAGWLVKACLIWVKNSLVMGRSDYHYRHEPIIYGWRDGGAHRWYGGRKHSTVLEEATGLSIVKNDSGVELTFNDGIRHCVLQVPYYEVISASDDTTSSAWKIDRPIRSDEHPTMKPVALPVRAILNSSRIGEVILDPFLGSGSTLIAAEKTGRICYGMEIDPHYCDVIVKRWENFTGKKAVREAR